MCLMLRTRSTMRVWTLILLKFGLGRVGTVDRARDMGVCEFVPPHTPQAVGAAACVLDA